MDLRSRSSGDDEGVLEGGILAKMELWSRSSGADEALVKIVAKLR